MARRRRAEGRARGRRGEPSGPRARLRPGRAADPRLLALEALVRVEEGAFVDRLLAPLEARLAERRERAFLHALVYGVLRHQGALDARLAPLVDRPLARLDPPLRAALRAGLAEACLLGRPPAVAVSATLDALRALAGPRPGALANAVLRRALAEGAPPLDPRDTLPAWLFERVAARLGEEGALNFVAALNEPPRAHLVALGPGEGARDALLDELAAAGVRALASPWHPRGVAVLEGALGGLGALAEGRAIALDGAAALVARLAAPADERPVADLAAAPGGKLLLLAAEGVAPLVGLEPVPGRLRALAQRVERAPLPARPALLAGSALSPPLAPGRYGTLLLDAPCSGTGTLRRRPDRRWRVSEEDIVEAAALQTRLLAAALPLLAPRGALVYAVCSLEPEEGLEQARALLARHAELEAEDPRVLLPGIDEALFGDDPPHLATRPERDGLEGFFALRVRRRA